MTSARSWTARHALACEPGNLGGSRPVTAQSFFHEEIEYEATWCSGRSLGYHDLGSGAGGLSGGDRRQLGAERGAGSLPTDEGHFPTVRAAARRLHHGW